MNEFHTDGYTLNGNPSKIGGGFTVFKNGNLLISNPVQKENFTNNEAELLAIQHACVEAGMGDTIVIDSQVIACWVRDGRSKVRPDLNWICKQCQGLIQKKLLKVVWKPREENFAGHYNEREFNA